MRSPNADETRLLREARETATKLHAAGVLSDEDRHAVFRICEQQSGADSETALPFERALTTVVQRGLEASGFGFVKSVALGVWHGSHLPAACVFQGPFASEAVLLVERLAFYAIVPQPRKKALLSLVGPLLPAGGSASRAAFNFVFKRYLPELQPLQTRHARSN